MTKRQRSHDIDELAARWVARIDRGPLRTDEETALEAWLSSDSRCLGAFAKAQAVSIHSERARALGHAFNPAEFVQAGSTPSGISRRILLLGSAAAAAVSAALVPRFGSHFGTKAISTEIGETRIVPLEDGSVITLNTASKISVAYSDRRRDVHLLQGEALFDVAKDRVRPFTVEAGDTQVRALGTSFAVLFEPQQPVKVTVREGVVELERSELSSEPPVVLAANTRVVAPSYAPISVKVITAEEVRRDLVWREGRIAFEGTTLEEAAETFLRYSNTRIVIDDPSIANARITGLFVSNDPVGFSKAVSISLGLKADVAEGMVRLTR